jgi:hypothetical protein
MLFVNISFSTLIASNSAVENEVPKDVEKVEDEVQHQIKEKEVEGKPAESSGPVEFVVSVIGKAKWNVLFVRLTKVFFSFFLDLFLMEIFGAPPILKSLGFNYRSLLPSFTSQFLKCQLLK